MVELSPVILACKLDRRGSEQREICQRCAVDVFTRHGHLCGNTAVPAGIPQEWILKCSLIPRDGREWVCYCWERSGVVLLAFPRKLL